MAKKFLTDINIAGGVYDSSGDIGNSGQVLSSTGSGVNWINATSLGKCNIPRRFYW